MVLLEWLDGRHLIVAITSAGRHPVAVDVQALDGSVGVVAVVARERAVGVGIDLVGRGLAVAVGVGPVAGLALAGADGSVLVVAIARAVGGPVLVLVLGLGYLGVGVVAVGAARRLTGPAVAVFVDAVDPIAVGVQAAGVDRIGGAGVPGGLAVVAVSGVGFGIGRVAVPVGVAAIDAIAVLVDAVAPVVLGAGTDRGIRCAAVFRVGRAVLVKIVDFDGAQTPAGGPQGGKRNKGWKMKTNGNPPKRESSRGERAGPRALVRGA